MQVAQENGSLSASIRQRRRERVIGRERQRQSLISSFSCFSLSARKIHSFYLLLRPLPPPSSWHAPDLVPLSFSPSSSSSSSAPLLPLMPHPAAWMKPFEKGWSWRSSSLHGYDQVSAGDNSLPTCLHSHGACIMISFPAWLDQHVLFTRSVQGEGSCISDHQCLFFGRWC